VAAFAYSSKNVTMLTRTKSDVLPGRIRTVVVRSSNPDDRPTSGPSYPALSSRFRPVELERRDRARARIARM